MSALSLAQFDIMAQPLPEDTKRSNSHPINREPKNTVISQVKRDNENGARQAILEDLFFDFHRSRIEVYKMNFIRGIFFGLGSVLGGTILVALAIWLLNAIGILVPSLAGFIDSIVSLMSNRT